MKDQYFGDVNDYRKYGLLRAIQSVTRLELLVAWMLTPGDGRSDGAKTSYLEQPVRWRRFDPGLFDGLSGQLARGPRGVSSIEACALIPRARFFSTIVPDARKERAAWLRTLLHACRGRDLVFLDPDNGVEVPSKPVGRRGSSKYVYWNEIASIWRSGASVLIYQHFTRRERHSFVDDLTGQLSACTSGALVSALWTPHVVFSIACQPRHAAALDAAIGVAEATWQGQIGRRTSRNSRSV